MDEPGGRNFKYFIEFSLRAASDFVIIYVYLYALRGVKNPRRHTDTRDELIENWDVSGNNDIAGCIDIDPHTLYALEHVSEVHEAV